MANQVKESSAAPDKVYRLVGGLLCLDFCNTVGGTREGVARESLHSYEHFISWCQQAGILSAEQVAHLRKKAEHGPFEAAEVLARALMLREAIYRIFYALLNGSAPETKQVELLNRELGVTLGRLRVQGQKDGTFEWGWSTSQVPLDYPLGPVAYSAANLLVSKPDCERVRQCQGGNCGWLFIDSSRNHSRCWCDMSDCGNRAKVRRHRQKHHRS